MGYYIYYPLENKIFVSRNAEFFENSFMVQEVSGSHRLLEMCGSDKGLEIIQEEYIQPYENTRKEHNEVAPIEVKPEPQDVGVPIRRSARIPQAPDRYEYYIDVEEYELGDINEPPNYKASLVDPKSNKWIEAMNTKMQYMKDNQVWILVELPPNVLYVDDILLMGNSVTMLKEVKSWLCKYFSMKDLGEAAYILGIKIIHDRSKRLITLSQCAYLEKILKKFRMENSKKGYTLMMKKPDYRKLQGAKTPTEVQRMLRVPYASAIGSIMYAVRCTRLDVAFAQNLCSRFQQNPGEIHWTAMKTILKYLRYTKDMVLVYRAKPEDELKKSAKQSTTAMSSIEAKYIAAAEASMEAVWMRKFIDGLLYFSIKDLAEAAYIFGIKIICDRSKRLIALSQRAYLEKILMKFRTENSKKGYTLMVEKPDCRKSQGAQTPNEVQRMQRVPYALAIGSIMYAMRYTRPDVVFAQNLCSRFQQNPSEIHWIAVKTILKYLRNTKELVLVFMGKT
ncbi:retrotransposon protein, putative, ty1-copia subclass [Tanacetum coccineum]